MKTILPLLLCLAVSTASLSDEAKILSYPEAYASESLTSFIEKYGDPNKMEEGTGAKHRRERHLVIDEPAYDPTVPPDLSVAEDVLYCFWRTAPHGEECVWFRRVNGEWMSFWNSHPSMILCGAKCSVAF